MIVLLMILSVLAGLALFVALIYFLVLWPLVRVLSRLENRALAGRA